MREIRSAPGQGRRVLPTRTPNGRPISAPTKPNVLTIGIPAALKPGPSLQGPAAPVASGKPTSVTGPRQRNAATIGGATIVVTIAARPMATAAIAPWSSPSMTACAVPCP